MTRQDINRALLQTSFLDGANGPYVEALQAKFEQDPNSVEPGWREFFDALGDDPASVEKTSQGASWKRPQWPLDSQERPHQRARRRLAGDREGGRRQTARQGGGRARDGGAERRIDPSRDARFACAR